jgi:hypothetical protein
MVKDSKRHCLEDITHMEGTCRVTNKKYTDLPNIQLQNTSEIKDEFKLHRILFRLRYPDVDIKHYCIIRTCSTEQCMNPEHYVRGVFNGPHGRRH